MNPLLSIAKLAVPAAAAGVIALGLAGTAAAQDKMRVILTDAVTPLVPNSVAMIAQSNGYFTKNGLSVEFIRVQATPSAVAALTSGQGDMANISVDTALQLVARGQVQGKAVLSPDKAIPFQIVSKSSIASVKDLAGKTFGVARIGSVDHTQSMTVLRTLGVDVDKLELVAIGDPPVRATALQAGRVDATSFSIGVWADLKSKADVSALKVMVPQADYFNAAPVVSKINFVTDAYAKNNAKQITAFIKAIMQASRDFHSNPQVWADAMAKERTDVQPATLKELGELFKNSWSANGGLNAKQLQFTADELYKGPDFKDLRKVAVADWVDTSYADAALKDIGKAPGLDDPGR
jgi:NitT/TauT family transport system substrate-binding protein